jgi:hypothetical protein
MVTQQSDRNSRAIEMTQAGSRYFAPRSVVQRMSPWIWAFGFCVWTYLLVVPVEWLPPWFRFGGSGISPLLSWSKIGHASAYATLTMFVVLVSSRWTERLALWGLLSAHAFGTEFIQTFVPTRTGCWMDVGIDHAGIFTGLVLVALWSRQRVPALVQPKEDSRREDQDADLLRHS